VKIVSFNINGIRARLHQLAALIDKYRPDIIGLQETKVANDAFPFEAVTELGYRAAVHGQKGHYGVAFLSPAGGGELADLRTGYAGEAADAQRRLIGCSVNYRGERLSIYNGYFPQGENREHPLKFPNKRRFYADLLRLLEDEYRADERLLVMGDMNVSPTDADIGIGEKNRLRWLRDGKCSFLPEEREWYGRLQDWGLVDAWRAQYPDETGIYSWFDYRSRGFDDDPRRGLRIDHMLVTRSLLANCSEVIIDYELRGMERPSDHCPVVLVLDE